MSTLRLASASSGAGKTQKLRELSHTSPAVVQLGDTQVRAFEILKDRLCAGKPKAFIADGIQTPALLFRTLCDHWHWGSLHLP